MQVMTRVWFLSQCVVRSLFTAPLTFTALAIYVVSCTQMVLDMITRFKREGEADVSDGKGGVDTAGGTGE